MAERSSSDRLHQTARLVAAYVGQSTLAASDLPDLIRSTYAALVGVSLPVSAPAEVLQPAVPVKKSVTAEAIICLECGQHKKMLKGHLNTAHGLSVDEYRAKWSLAADYPVVAPSYAAHRSQLALSFGLGRKKAEDESGKMASPAEGTPRHNYPASRWSKPSK